MTVRALVLLAAAGALAGGGVPARAQDSGPAPLAQRRAVNPPAGEPVLLLPATDALTGKALSAEQSRRLSEARTHRLSGRADRALAVLRSLLAECPHHPGLIAETIAIHAEREEWAAIEKLARSERAALRDSVTLGHELVQALAQLRRPRDAAAVAIEVWSVAPSESDWAIAVIERAEGADDRAAREALRRAAEKRPHRSDLARGLARLEARAGDVRPALKALGAADRAEGRWRLRWGTAEEILLNHTSRDSAAAAEILLDLSSDPGADPAYRASAAQRYWELAAVRADVRDGASRVRRALADVPAARWNPELRLKVARALRQSGRTAEVRELLAPGGGRDTAPDFELERLLTDLRDGPPARALPGLRALAESSPEAAFRYAEALFFAGEADSAHAWYTRASADAAAPNAGAALERLYLLEEPAARPAIAAFGRIAYARWRGDHAGFQALSDSLFRALPRGPAWAEAAMLASAAHEDDARAALAPLLALADSLPDDRLAPLARQKAGDLYRTRLNDEAAAIRQYEECLARYPRAWNAAEVRRTLEQLRRGISRKA